MKKIKKMAALLLAMAMSASVSVASLAATTTYTYINDVAFDLVHDIEIGGYNCDVDAIVSDSRYEVESVSITNEPEESWDDGDKPKVSVVLWVRDEETYRFKSGIAKTDVTIDTEDGTVKSVTRGSSGKKLTVKVELPVLAHDAGFYESALVVEDIYFDSETGIGSWEENEYAERYEVKLYRNDSYLAGTFKTTELDYDFSKYFERKGTYFFQVRGVKDKKNSSTDYKGEWRDSEELTVDSEEAKNIRLYGGYDENHTSSSTSGSSNNSPSSNAKPAASNNTASGGWFQNAYGWWWCNPDRTYPTNTWKEINGSWYYFDQSGYCLMNSWIKSQNDGLWYYCGSNGAMVTNVWVLSGGK